MTLSSDSRAVAGASPPDWKFSQVFGERAPGEELQDVDIISAMGFDASGDYLAVGDLGGRIVIFERKDAKHTSSQPLTRRTELEKRDFKTPWNPEFQYKTEFQSHEPEFDYLKSLEIEEKINKVEWCATPNGSRFILSTNNKTIKLWKVKEHKVKKVKEMDPFPFVSSENALLSESSYVTEKNKPSDSVPNGHHPEWMEKMTKSMSISHDQFADMEDTPHTRCRKTYAHAHDFNINSISTNSDGETFISADDLRINLWNLDISGQCFNIVDMKPTNMEDLTEVITTAEFHPMRCNLFSYGSSRGFIRLVDMRQSALCDHSALILQDEDLCGSKLFFSELVVSISDMKFSKDGWNILTRDYMNLKLWDMRMDSSPVARYKIHEHLRPKLYELYDNDCIFDKFSCCLSGDGLHFATGSYSNNLCIFSRGVGSEEGITIEATKHPVRKPVLHDTPRARRSSLSNLTRGFYRPGNENSSSASNDSSCNLNSKLLRMTWHPKNDLIACAAGNSLYMYYA